MYPLITRLLCLFLLPLTAFAEDKTLNLYSWSGVIPSFVIQQFEKETGIKVNQSTYENNEVMYAKLRVSQASHYDIIVPTSNFIDRLRKQGRLEKLDKSKLPNWKHLNPSLLHLPFDPTAEYSVPYFWGSTGLFYNDRYHHHDAPTQWNDLWNKAYRDQLLLLDDIRDVFGMALLSLGYSVNERNPEHIKAAFLKLQALMPNVKVFSADTIISIIIDDDATIGMTWNGDLYKASRENKQVQYRYPTDGFVIWVDNLAVPKHPPHPKATYAFLNFILRPDIAKELALYTGFATANLSGQQLLPKEIRTNTTIYPDKATLKRGQYLMDIGEETLAIYASYWNELKMQS